MQMPLSCSCYTLGCISFLQGEIVVYKLEGKDIPIVHRVMERHEFPEEEDTLYLTKGDNNRIDDRGLYNEGQLWLKRDAMLGRAVGFLPYAGYATILLNENQAVKFLVVALMGVFVLTSKE